jgi:hypothetical protein
METRSKKAHTKGASRVSWLNLHMVIRDVNIRKMIYAYLTPYDRLVVECAHTSKWRSSIAFTQGLALSFAEYCAQHGYLSLLQWAVANGVHMNSRVSCYAAYSGHLEMLQWLIAKGCPLNSSACYYARKNNRVEVLTWLRYNVCVCRGMYHL